MILWVSSLGWAQQGRSTDLGWAFHTSAISCLIGYGLAALRWLSWNCLAYSLPMESHLPTDWSWLVLRATAGGPPSPEWWPGSEPTYCYSTVFHWSSKSRGHPRFKGWEIKISWWEKLQSHLQKIFANLFSHLSATLWWLQNWAQIIYLSILIPFYR